MHYDVDDVVIFAIETIEQVGDKRSFRNSGIMVGEQVGD